jgi:hypothetical protein
LFGDSCEGETAGRKEQGQKRKHKKGGTPDQIIDQKRDETAANAGQRKFDRNQFRRINVKLI